MRDARLVLFEHLFYEGRHGEARALVTESLASTSDDREELDWKMAEAMIDRAEGKLERALLTHMRARPLFDRVTDLTAKGKFANGQAYTCGLLWERDRVESYLDDAFLGYEEAVWLFEEGGEKHLAAYVLNNLSILKSSVGLYDEAHAYLERARELFEGEPARQAEVDDTRAHAFILEGKALPALTAASASVHALSQTDELHTLRKSIPTLYKALDLYCPDYRTEALMSSVKASGLAKVVEDYEREIIRCALTESARSVTRAAELLQITRQGLEYKIKSFGLESLTVRRGK